MNIRIGSGFDVHKICPGNGLWLGGVYIESDLSLIGHSDADVLLHAVCDAIYGALANGDIGMHFPDTLEQNKGRPSKDFLDHAMQLLTHERYSILNMDVTVIGEKPKISPHRELIRNSLADLIKIPLDKVSVKATTTEKLGFTGRGEGIAVNVMILVIR